MDFCILSISGLFLQQRNKSEITGMSSSNGEDLQEVLVIAFISTVLLLTLLLSFGYGCIRLRDYRMFQKHPPEDCDYSETEEVNYSEYVYSEVRSPSVGCRSNSPPVLAEIPEQKSPAAKSLGSQLSSEASCLPGLEPLSGAPWAVDYAVKERAQLTDEDHSAQWDLASSSDTDIGGDEKSGQSEHGRKNEFSEMLRPSFCHPMNIDHFMPDIERSKYSSSLPSTPTEVDDGRFCPMYSPDNGGPWGLCPLLYKDFP
ncbi:uncharacterized protein LOC115094573 [Rhinatrema bivittatum]|uniref:uncharacterized protein LOC115094573 n=1 Tax=Rhinatrema bivittatum TaxID=194408 RepID=UPI00112EE577|nr:uncharacterized protein LOC115094573 [Rhinatrema bivittatum]XP_029463628.1 uncharacterized protein LOC115094573 [Rhinatrema bivittatum]